VIWLPSGVIATCCTILSAVQKPYKSHCYVSKLWDSETGAHIKLLYHTFEETNMFLPIMTALPSFRYLGLSIPSTQIFGMHKAGIKYVLFYLVSPLIDVLLYQMIIISLVLKYGKYLKKINFYYTPWALINSM